MLRRRQSREDGLQHAPVRRNTKTYRLIGIILSFVVFRFVLIRHGIGIIVIRLNRPLNGRGILGSRWFLGRRRGCRRGLRFRRSGKFHNRLVG